VALEIVTEGTEASVALEIVTEGTEASVALEIVTEGTEASVALEIVTEGSARRKPLPIIGKGFSVQQNRLNVSTIHNAQRCRSFRTMFLAFAIFQIPGQPGTNRLGLPCKRALIPQPDNATGPVEFRQTQIRFIPVDNVTKITVNP
jgi:hypothetical protein